MQLKFLNDKEVDELTFLSLLQIQKKCNRFRFCPEISDGNAICLYSRGGITSLKQIRELLKGGAEKFVYALQLLAILLIRKGKLFCSQSVECINQDISKNWFEKEWLFLYALCQDKSESHHGPKRLNPLESRNFTKFCIQ